MVTRHFALGESPGDSYIQMFGTPARTYQFAAYTIMVWDKNLIAWLNR